MFIISETAQDTVETQLQLKTYMRYVELFHFQ